MEDLLLRRELAEEYCKDGYRLAWIEGDLAAGLAEFKKALELWPDSTQAHHQIGLIYFHSSKRDLLSALAEFEAVTRLAGDWSEGYLWQANTLQDLGRNGEAESAYREAARLTPDDSRIHISFAACLVKQSKFKDAIASFRHGIALKPAYGEISARMMLADALRENGQIKEAIEQWKIVATMDAVWSYEQEEPELAKKFLAQFGR